METKIMETCRIPDKDIFSISNIRKCEKYVFAMQQRLDKAIATYDAKRIKHILNLLIHRSRAVKILAVYRITKINDGRKTAGVDGISIPNDKDKANKIRLSLLNAINVKEAPDPIRRIHIPKPNGKKRPLGIPTIKDRIIQEILRMSLEPIVENRSHDNSFGFRPKRSCHDAIDALHKKLAARNRYRYIIEGDIKGCFDNISHDHILKTLKSWYIPSSITKIIQGILKAEIFHNGKVYDSETGTPQGGVISPMLANVALTRFDRFVSQVFGKGHNAGYSSPMVRYADDFVITCQSKAKAKVIKSRISELLLNEIGLTLSEEKTKVTHICDGFNFLGFNIKKHRKKHHSKSRADMSNFILLIKPQKEKIQSILNECSKTLGTNITTPQKAVIALLNPKLKGWGNYYKFVVSSNTFTKIDTIMWRKVFNWGRKRHKNKGKDWIVKTYFRNKHQWFVNEDGTQLQSVYDLFTGKRYIKIKQGQRVYCKEHATYWERREYLNAYDRLYSRTARHLFDKQKGKCSYCKTHISDKDIIQSKSHVHHMQPKKYGGTESYSNLRLLHSVCHSELHSKFSLAEMWYMYKEKTDYISTLQTS